MSRRKLRVGVVGVGNCASSFVQGLSHYRDTPANEPVPGLTNAELGGYHVRDIEISAAFDVSAAKVGRDVSEAIFAAPNNTARFAAALPMLRDDFIQTFVKSALPGYVLGNLAGLATAIRLTRSLSRSAASTVAWMSTSEPQARSGRPA